MCGRFTLASDGDTLAAEFGVRELSSWLPRYNIAPTQAVLALVRDGRGFKAARLHWGLVPSWAKDRKMSARLINARAETVADKPSFRSAFKQRRCLILADGYYEWVKQGPAKQPMYIRRGDGVPFAFAGLWERWIDENAAPFNSCTIITCAANDDLAPLHHRMPVVLEKSDYAAWIDAADSASVHLDLLKPAATGTFRAWAVSTYVNAPAHEGPDCTRPIAA
jgi:putative SOS response-associated peptidase YedK